MCNKRLKNVFQPNFSVTEKKFTNFLVPPVIINTIAYTFHWQNTQAYFILRPMAVGLCRNLGENASLKRNNQ